MNPPIPRLVVLGAEMEVAADEYLAAATSDAEYADLQARCDAPQAMIDVYANGSTLVYRDAVQAIQELSLDLSPLPADLAITLEGLRKMGTWKPSAIRERVLARRPLAATSRRSYNCAAAIDVINRFIEQAEAERLYHAQGDMLISEGITTESVERGRALQHHLDPTPTLDFAQVPKLSNV